MTEPIVEILYQDDYLVAINKPHGLLVHKTNIATDATVFAVQLVRDQIGKYVYPIHRLDRKTSGVLLFALDAEMNKLVQQQFMNHSVQKKYLAIVRGYFPEVIEVDYALTNDRDKVQEAQTHFRLLSKTEIDVPLGKHPTSRYSLIEAMPKTGRMHQIRKHCNHLRHPIIGDRPHGCSKQNRLFLQKWNLSKMLLHAAELSIQHPITKELLVIEAPRSAAFLRIQSLLGL